MLLLYFFTGIGLNARLDDLISGGRPLLVLAGGPGWDAELLPPEVMIPANLTEAMSLVMAAADSFATPT